MPQEHMEPWEGLQQSGGHESAMTFLLICMQLNITNGRGFIRLIYFSYFTCVWDY
jgi:hypothetical protein